MNFTISLLTAPEPRVFGLDQQTLISISIQLLNACILCAVLTFILYKPVRKFMQTRAEKIKAQMDNAEKSNAEAESLKNSYSKKLKDIELERIEIIDEAREVAAEKSKQMTDDAKREIHILRERAEADIQRERERLKEEIGRHILDISTAMAGKFVSQTIDKEMQDKIFEETMAELEATAWSN